MLARPIICKTLRIIARLDTGQEDIHVIAGAWWFGNYLETFQKELAQFPQTYNLGDKEHFKVPEDYQCSAIWTKRIDQILNN